MLTTKEANEVRAEYVKDFINFAKEKYGDDIALINSNSFNFPIVYGDKEGFIEVVVKVPKSDDDECYAKREEYILKLKEQAEKKAAAEEKKKKKIAADEKRRAEAKAKRERLEAENEM